MAITELYDSHSRFPLSFYNTLTLISQLLNTTTHGVTKQNLTTVKTPLMQWFSHCLLVLIFLFLLSTMREERSSITVMHHTTPTNLTYDTSKYPHDITYTLFFSSSSCAFFFCITTTIKHYTKSCTTPWAIFPTSVENKSPTLPTPNGNKMHLQTEPYLQLRVSILVW